MAEYLELHPIDPQPRLILQAAELVRGAIREGAALVGGLSPGELASSVSAGRLLSPSWAPELINTSPG